MQLFIMTSTVLACKCNSQSHTIWAFTELDPAFQHSTATPACWRRSTGLHWISLLILLLSTSPVPKKSNEECETDCSANKPEQTRLEEQQSSFIKLDSFLFASENLRDWQFSQVYLVCYKKSKYIKTRTEVFFLVGGLSLSFILLFCFQGYTKKPPCMIK